MKKLSILLLLNLSFLSLFAQQTTMPAKCTNPRGGILVGGDFIISPQFACLGINDNATTYFASNGVSPSGGKLNNLAYIFNFKDGDNIVFPNPTHTSTKVSVPRTYWILQGGNEKGSAYITCKSVEVIQTEQPDVEILLVAIKV